MKDLIFWSKWTTPTKILYWLSLLLFAFSIGYFVAYHFIGLDAILDWDVEYDIKNVTTNLEIFRHKIFDVPVNSENYVVLQYFKASLVKINYLSATIFLLLTVFAACLGLAVVTTYKKLLWFVPGSALFAAWLSAFKLDLLGVFGLENNTLLAIMLVVYLGLAYVFHSLYTRINFLSRFLTFLLVSIVFGFLIIQYSSVSSPVLYLTNFGLVVPAIITVLFIFIIGYEIIHLALSVITFSRNSNPWVVPMNLLIVTILYLGNILLYYLYKEGELSWEVPYNVYLFFPICGVLGIWTHRKRSVLHKHILPYAPGGAFLYLAFGIVSFSTVAYILSISLTPAIIIFEYVFFCAQIAFGLAFFAYSVRNFYKPMVHNMPIHKMIFAPKLMGHGALRGAALVLMVVLLRDKAIVFSNYVNSTYANLKADTFMSDGHQLIAIENYEDALSYYPGGHHASYSLASIHMKNNNFGKASNILNDVNEGESTEYLIASLSAAFKGAKKSMRDILILKEGIKLFPESPYVMNNLGLAYYEIGSLDSAVHYLSKGALSMEKEVLSANLLGVAALKNLGGNKEELELDKSFINSKPYMTNAYALANVLDTKLDHEFDINLLDDVVGGVELSLVNNLVDNDITNVPEGLNDKIQYWIDSVIYDSNLDNARLTLAKSLVYNHDLREGVRVLESLTKNSSEQQYPYYADFTGVIQLKAGLYQQAYKNLVGADQALQLSEHNFARENAAIASLEMFDTVYATALFDYLARKNPTKRVAFQAMTEMMDGNYDSTDLHRAAFLIFHPKAEKENPFEILNKFTNDGLKSYVIVELLEKALINNDAVMIEKLWEEMPKAIEDKLLYYSVNLLNLKTHLAFNNFKALEEDLSKLELSAFDNRWKLYFEAQVAYFNKDVAKSEELFTQVLKMFPNNPDIWSAAIDFYTREEQIEEAYELCADYLRRYNPTKKMLKNYVDLSLQNNLFDFAESTVLELEEFMEEKEYQEFVAAYQKSIEEWDEQQIEESTIEADKLEE